MRSRFDIVFGCALGFAVACIIFLPRYGLLDALTEVRAARPERRLPLVECKCKHQILSRELVASLCQASDNRGPWFQECIYR